MAVNEETLAAIQKKRSEVGSYAAVAKAIGLPSGTLGNAINGYGVSRRLENRIRLGLGLVSLPPIDGRRSISVSEATFTRLQDARGGWTWEEFMNYVLITLADVRGE